MTISSFSFIFFAWFVRLQFGLLNDFDRFDADSIGTVMDDDDDARKTTTRRDKNLRINRQIIQFWYFIDFCLGNKYKHRFGWYIIHNLLAFFTLLVTFSHTFGICLAFCIASTEFNFISDFI